jgi:predicted Zn finger-like uncharacterized protein
MLMMMGNAFGMADAEKAWVNKVMADTSDWLLCGTCAERADASYSTTSNSSSAPAEEPPAKVAENYVAATPVQPEYMRIDCSHCKKNIRVKVKLAGKNVKCPHCQKVFTAVQPQAALAEDAASEAAAAKPAPAPKPARERKPVKTKAREAKSPNERASPAVAAVLIKVFLYLLGVAILFPVAFFWLEFHWFWAASRCCCRFGPCSACPRFSRNTGLPTRSWPNG